MTVRPFILSAIAAAAGATAGLAVAFAGEIGIGITNLSYYDQSFAMADMMRQSQFRSMEWSYDVGADANGAPTMDFRLVYNSNVTGAGTYKLKFKGQATVSGVTNKVYDAGANTTTADFVLASNATGNAWIEFTNTRRTPESVAADGVTEVQLFRPGYATDGSAVFTTEFIAAMQKFNVIRTMDFSQANLNPNEAWADRTKIDFLGNTDIKGQSWELMILLANAANRDLWINVPVKANDAYIDKLAKLFRYGSDGSEPYTSVQASPVYPPLNPGLKVYVEYGNEIWNTGPGFSGFGWCLDYANANRLNTSHPIAYDGAVTDQWLALRRWVAYRSAAISLAFRAVFGDAAMMSRVRPILSTQVGNANNYLRDGLLWADGYHGNVGSLWYGGGGAAYFPTDTEPTDTEPATMTAYFAGLPSALFATRVATDTTWVNGFGLKNIAYEGGPDPGGSPLGGISGSVELCYAYSNDPRMKDRMQVAHNTWVANGGDMLVCYIYSGPAPWSFTNGVSGAVVSDTTSIKMQAIDAIRAGSSVAPTLGTLVPGTVYFRASNSGVIDITEGGTQWGYSGTAYRIRPHATDPAKSEFLLIPTHTTAGGVFNVSYTAYDAAVGASAEIFANGVLLGTVLANQGAAGQAIKSQTIAAVLEPGVTVFRIRTKVGTELWLKDLIVEPA